MRAKNSGCSEVGIVGVEQVIICGFRIFNFELQVISERIEKGNFRIVRVIVQPANGIKEENLKVYS